MGTKTTITILTLNFISLFSKSQSQGTTRYVSSSIATASDLERVARELQDGMSEFRAMNTNLQHIGNEIGDLEKALITSMTNNQEQHRQILEHVEQETSSNLLSALNTITTTLASGQDKMSGAFINGQDKIATQMTQVVSELSKLPIDIKEAGVNEKAGLDSVADKVFSSIQALKEELRNTGTYLTDHLENSVDKSGDKNEKSLIALGENVKNLDGNNKQALDVIAEKVSSLENELKNTGMNMVNSIGGGNSEVAVSITKAKESIDTLAENVQASVTGLKTELKSTGNGVIDAIDAAGNKNKGSLDAIGGHDKERNYLLQNITNNVKVSGEDNKAELKAIMRVGEARNFVLSNMSVNVQVSGGLIKKGLDILGTNTVQVAEKLQMLDDNFKLNLGSITDSITGSGVSSKAGLDKLIEATVNAGNFNKESLDGLQSELRQAGDKLTAGIADGNEKISKGITTGTLKIADKISSTIAEGTKNIADSVSGGAEIMEKSISEGSTKIVESNVKIATAVDGTKTSLDNIHISANKIGANVGNAATNIESVSKNIEIAGSKNKEALTKIETNAAISATNLERIANNVEKSGEDNKEALINVEGRLETVANNIQTTANNVEFLATNVDKVAVKVENLGTIVEQAGMDNKETLKDIGNDIQASDEHSKKSLEDLKQAIKDFQMQRSKDTNNVIQTLTAYKGTLTADIGNVKEELTQIGNNIMNAATTAEQKKDIVRLAKKIECSDDCLVSEEQADAIIEGQERNDDNIDDLQDTIIHKSTNLPLSPPATTKRRKRSAEILKKFGKYGLKQLPSLGSIIATAASDQSKDDAFQFLKPEGYFTKEDDAVKDVKDREFTFDGLTNLGHLYETGTLPDQKTKDEHDSKYVSKEGYRLSDLGIGKFVPLQYPWNPKNSPNMCKDANLKDSDGNPSPNCTEFKFSELLFNEIEKHVRNRIFGVENCIEDADCKLQSNTKKPYCNKPAKTCVECQEDEHCQNEKRRNICDKNRGMCVKCTTENTKHCKKPKYQACHNNQCSQCSQLTQETDCKIHGFKICTKGWCKSASGRFPPNSATKHKHHRHKLLTKHEWNARVVKPLQQKTDLITKLRTEQSSNAKIFADARRDYINILNANTLSLDGMAALNNGNNLHLRDQALSNEWSRHEEGQEKLLRIVDLIQNMFENDDLNEALKNSTEKINESRLNATKKLEKVWKTFVDKTKKHTHAFTDPSGGAPGKTVPSEQFEVSKRRGKRYTVLKDTDYQVEAGHKKDTQDDDLHWLYTDVTSEQVGKKLARRMAEEAGEYQQLLDQGKQERRISPRFKF